MSLEKAYPNKKAAFHPLSAPPPLEGRPVVPTLASPPVSPVLYLVQVAMTLPTPTESIKNKSTFRHCVSSG